MKKKDIHIGATYLVKVASNVVPVTIRAEQKNGGWRGQSVKTGKTIRIRSPQRLLKRLDESQREQASAQHAAQHVRKDIATIVEAVKKSNLAEGITIPAKRMSCLDAAAKVLEEAGEPMNTAAMFDAMVAKGYWASDKATPSNTIYSAILREIKTKGNESRFVKAERGKFALASSH